jgi:N-acetylated-alpha-linked acidic dipeptidase
LGLWLIVLAGSGAPRLVDGPRGPSAPPAGFSSAKARAELDIEQPALALADPAHVQAFARKLAERPHVAGTKGDAATRDYVVKQMKSWGLKTEVKEYEVYMPMPTETRLEMLAPERKRFKLGEPAIPEDPDSADRHVPPMNAYAGSGDVTGELVYANFGLEEDFDQLERQGVTVRGKVVLVRYGRIYRGAKARNAEARGAAGCILYSDPSEDGFARGAVYPKGPFRPPPAVQRGSLKNGAPGDPTTPGFPSLRGVKRLPLEQVKELIKIPVVPVGYDVAGELLRALGGPTVGDGWQGGLPFQYHIGPGPVSVRLKIKHDAKYRAIWDTIGTIQGSEFPDDWIILGAHRDAWNNGAMDNVSGTAALMEAARVLSLLAKQGLRPRRTLLFATWDAEEWGVTGSTEWCEEMAATLSARGIAYLNLDVAASGPTFGASASPSLNALVREVTQRVTYPGSTDSVYEAWRKGAPASEDVRLGTLGGGSDFAGFFNHLGIPSVNHGFGGPGGIYHSAYDTTRWMETFGDPGYRFHTAAAQIAVLLALRLANADLLPFDYVEYARTLDGFLSDIEKTLGPDPKWKEVNSEVCRRSLVEFVEAAEFLRKTAATALNRDLDAKMADRFQQANAALVQVERALTRPQGLEGRPWYRNVVFAADERNGYATIVLPTINEAIMAGDVARTQREIADLAERVRAAAMKLRQAAEALTPEAATRASNQ